MDEIAEFNFINISFTIDYVTLNLAEMTDWLTQLKTRLVI